MERINIPFDLKTEHEWVFKEYNKPLSRYEAFIDLIVSAYCSDFFRDKNKGSISIIKSRQAKEWNWSISKLNTFLEKLHAVGLIHLEKGRSRTTINIVDYEKYYST